MRAIVLVLIGVGCAAEDAGEGDAAIDDGGTPVEDPGGSKPEACSGPTALNFFGETSSDVLTSGIELPLSQGIQLGYHLQIGLTVASPEPDVAWAIEAVDVETGEVVAASGAIQYTGLTAWNGETCTGYLPDKEVRIGDGTSTAEALACALDGRTVRAEAYATTIENGDEPIGEPQATVDILVNWDC